MNETIEHDKQVAVAQEGVGDSHSIMRLVERAMATPDFDVAKLQALLDVKERWEKDEARKAFVAALNAFKADPPEISKNKQVSYATSKGTTAYKHATLDNVSALIGRALAEHQISHRWEVEQLDGGRIKVTCVLTHALGHSERVPLESKADDSGGKNSIQAIGSAVTYLQRYTLLAATGMAVKDQDDDGGLGKGKAMPEGVRADWLAAIEEITSMDKSDELWKKIAAACTELGDIPSYDVLKAAMAKKRKTLRPA